MMPHKIIFKLIACTFISFLACSKQNYHNKTLLGDFQLTEHSQILVGNNWREIKIEVIDREQNSVSKNITNQFLQTDLDDEIIFSADGTYVFNEGKTKAKKESSQFYENGFWQLRNDELTLATRNSKTSYLIKDLSTNILVLKLLVKNEDYYYILTFQPI